MNARSRPELRSTSSPVRNATSYTCCCPPQSNPKMLSLQSHRHPSLRRQNSASAAFTRLTCSRSRGAARRSSSRSAPNPIPLASTPGATSRSNRTIGAVFHRRSFSVSGFSRARRNPSLSVRESLLASSSSPDPTGLDATTTTASVCGTMSECADTPLATRHASASGRAARHHVRSRSLCAGTTRRVTSDATPRAPTPHRARRNGSRSSSRGSSSLSSTTPFPGVTSRLGDGVVQGRDRRAGAVRAHLREPADLLLADARVIRQGQTVGPELLDELQHPGARADGHGHLFLVDVKHVVEHGEAEHALGVERGAVGAERGSDGAESPAVRIRPLDALEQLLGGLGLDVPLAAHLLRRAPVVNHLPRSGFVNSTEEYRSSSAAAATATTIAERGTRRARGSDRARCSRRRRAGGARGGGVRVLVHQRARGVVRACPRASGAGPRTGRTPGGRRWRARGTEAGDAEGREGARTRERARGGAVGRPGATKRRPRRTTRNARAPRTPRGDASRRTEDAGKAPDRGRTTRRARGKSALPAWSSQVQEAGARRGADDARHHVGDFPDRLLSCDTSVRYQGGPPRRFSVTD